MNLYTSNFLHETNNDCPTGKRKKERDAELRVHAEIKASLKELDRFEDRQLAFRRLVACVQLRTGLLRPTRGEGSAGWAAPVFLIHRLKNLAARQAHWLQRCETWCPADRNLRPVFRSLARHLLTHYPVPAFVDSAWDLPLGPEGFRQQSWYIRLGRGSSLRQLNLPVVLTRHMEHWVRQAPDHYSVNQALRYGEVRGMGGSEGLARELVSGKLGECIQQAEFWRSVLWFFVNHPEMPLEHVNPVVDFVHYNKFAGEEVMTENGVVNRPAPWPDFAIKGRTLRSMQRLVCAWHSELSKATPRQSVSWHKSGIEGYRFLEKRDSEEGDLDWTIRELLDGAALHAEGQTMHHCVYSYAQRCRRGETTIWSLRLRLREREKRIATIEVNARRRMITQVRAKFNQRPGTRAHEIISQWADHAGLKWE